MLELAVAGSALLTMQVLFCLPTRRYPFYRMFVDLLDDVRRFIFMLFSLAFAKLWDLCVRFDRQADPVQTKSSDSEDFSLKWGNPDNTFVHFVPYRTPENFDQKTEQKEGFKDSSFNSDFGTEGSELPKIYTQDDLDGAVNHSRHKDLLNYIQRKREMADAYNATIDGLRQEHEEDLQAVKQKYEAIVAQVEQQWKSELRMTEHDLRKQLSDLQAEIDWLTRIDPDAEGKEQLRQLVQMRGAGLSRSQIVQRLLGGKMEGNSRAKYQRQYDDLIFNYGVDWLKELHSYGLSSQKIVKAVWGDFKDSSEANYITRVEKAIEDSSAQENLSYKNSPSNNAPNNVIRLHRVS